MAGTPPRKNPATRVSVPAAQELRPDAAVHEEVARRAYDLYLARGGEHGRDLDDWLRAERELRIVLST